jgi:hypothetical protein
MDERAELVAKLDVQRDVAFGLEMYRKHCLSPAANSTANWTDTRANLSFSRQGRLTEAEWLAPNERRHEKLTSFRQRSGRISQ